VTDLAPEILAHSQATLEDVRRLQEELVELLARLNAPGEITPVPLSVDQLVKYFPRRVEQRPMSVGLLNPHNLTVYLAMGGGSATLEGEAVPVAPQSALILPVAANAIELGIDPADSDSLAILGSDTAVVFLLRFETVQPFFFSSFGVGA
jgi:hypothetical protein